MALAEDLQRLMGYGMGPDSNAEISFKIKPLGQIANVAPGLGAQQQQSAPGGGVQTPLNQPSSPTLTAGGIGEGQGGNPSAPPPPQVGAINPGAGNPTLVPRPGGPHIDPPNTLMPNPGGEPVYPGDVQFDRTFGGADSIANIRQGLGLPTDVVPPGEAPTGPFVQPPQANLMASAVVNPEDPNAPPPAAPAPAPPGTVVPANMQVRNTPLNLPGNPLGKYTDDIYEAAVAQLQFETKSRYAQLLQELGFINDQGVFMPGTLETDALRQRGEIGDQRRLALEQVLQDAARGSTVFSGRRATNEANAQRPYDTALANLETVLGRELAGRYQSLGDLTRQFELSRNQLLAEAAERFAAQNTPTGGDDFSGGPTGSGRDPNTAAISQYSSDIARLRAEQGQGTAGRPAGSLGLGIGVGYNGVTVKAPPQAPNAKQIIVTSGPNPRIVGYIDANGNYVAWNGGPLGGGSSGGGSSTPRSGGGGPLRTQ